MNAEHHVDSLARRAERLLPSTAEYFPGRSHFAAAFAERIFCAVIRGESVGARNGRGTLLMMASRLWVIAGDDVHAEAARAACSALMLGHISPKDNTHGPH